MVSCISSYEKRVVVYNSRNGLIVFRPGGVLCLMTEVDWIKGASFSAMLRKRTNKKIGKNNKTNSSYPGSSEDSVNKCLDPRYIAPYIYAGSDGRHLSPK